MTESPAASIDSAAPEWRWVGSPSPTVRLGGHSHRQAMVPALDRLEPDLASKLAVLTGTEWRPDERYWSEFQTFEGVMAVVWNGNEHYAHFLFSSEPVAIVAPNQPEAPPTVGTVVPYRMLEPLWEASNAGLRTVLTGCREPSRAIVVGTPPPKSEAHIRAHLEAEPGYAAAIAAQGFTPSTAPICDVGTRVAAWQSLQQSFERSAQSVGASFIPVPESTRAPDGTLLPELSSADATHANIQFGVIMWMEILRHLGEAR